MGRLLCGLGLSLALMAQAPAHAASPGGCDAFDWPLKTELAWMAAADPVAVDAGTEIASKPDKAIELRLVPQAEAKLAAQPSGKPKSLPDVAYAGSVTIGTIEKAGVYQVTLSSPGWIDVLQSGKTLAAVAHTGKSDCPAIRKSVRFDLQTGPVTLQVTSAPAQSVKLAIKMAD